MTWDGAGYNFTRRDGSKLKSIGIVYTQFLEGLMKSNGFEVKYRTVFGNDVIASFSALGFSKQLRAIRKNCRT
ncbi:hypothetical protein [uncultured Roseibium sp.]|uniref:hypothetical protein n=1 Tax=uncultured Roseibium sp. TaxID=1936171 RepID=UPI0032176A4E